MRTYPALASIGNVTAMASRFAAPDVLGCAHMSLPVPVPGPDGLRIMFVYCGERSEHPDGRPSAMSAPRFFSSVNAETGRVMELAPFAPEVWGLTAGAEWTAWRPLDREHGYQERVDRFNQTMDRLLGLFAGAHRSSSAQARTLRADALALYKALAEPPLVATYAAIGPAFFGWLRQTSE